MKAKPEPANKSITFRLDATLMAELQKLRETPLGRLSLNRTVESVLREGLAAIAKKRSLSAMVPSRTKKGARP